MKRWPFTRREVLLAGSGLALAGCPAPVDPGPRTLDPQPYDHATRVAFAPDGLPLSRTLFPQTVASGGMRTDAVRLWTRAEGLTQLTLRVWRDVGSATEVALVTEQTVDVPAHGNVQVAVSGLAPATWYRYAFFPADLSARSPIGKVRTALPDDWDEPVTIGATSCAKVTYAPYASLSTMSKQNLDLWLHLGDVSYNDTATSLDEYRALYRAQLADPGYRDLFESAGGYLTWDDHDFFNNFDPEKLADLGRIADAKAAWFESLPVEKDAQDRIWRSYCWGKTVEVFVVDARTERLPSTRETAQEQYLSRAQMDWLKAGLLGSPCHFKVVMNSVPITNMPPPLWGGQADRWQGWVTQRDELLDSLTGNDVKNVWFVSGDFHLGLVMRLEKDGPRSKYLEVAAGPAAHVNPLAVLLEPGQEANRETAFPKQQFLFASGGYNSTVLTFDPKTDTVRVVYIDAKTDTTTLDRTFTFGE